jgi:predicted enzyme related to lactoylglutathione lyase
MPRVIHFEIPADNPDRAVQFYTKIFGWTFQKWDGPQDYWLVSTGDKGPGINGGLLRRSHPGAGTVNTVDVTSVDEMVRAVEKAGGTIVAPKMPIPGVGYLAYCQDPEGNTFGLMQSDPAAA